MKNTDLRKVLMPKNMSFVMFDKSMLSMSYYFIFNGEKWISTITIITIITHYPFA